MSKNTDWMSLPSFTGSIDFADFPSSAACSTIDGNVPGCVVD
jgi:hypothetical protein